MRTDSRNNRSRVPEDEPILCDVEIKMKPCFENGDMRNGGTGTQIRIGDWRDNFGATGKAIREDSSCRRRAGWSFSTR